MCKASIYKKAVCVMACLARRTCVTETHGVEVGDAGFGNTPISYP